ncbi:MAG: ABC transporter permease [Leptothrix sp. (in: b-proteobacteria)]
MDSIRLPQFVLLWTDALLWALALGLLAGARLGWRSPAWRAKLRRVAHDPAAVSAALLLALFALVALADSVHFRRQLPADGRAPVYATRTESLLELLLARPLAMRESSYSRPLATFGFGKESIERNGQTVREHVRLLHAGRHLSDPATQWLPDLLWRGAVGLSTGLALPAGLAWLAWRRRPRPLALTPAERAAWITACALGALIGLLVGWGAQYHVLGTDRTGNDVLVQALQGVRTAFVIGGLATVATLPLAVGLGIVSGYCGGWVDELIQYTYTVMSAVPNVLLIAACVLMVQVALDQHPEWAATQLERADLKIVMLCAILGATGWAGLCRLVRAETLKLRELDFVHAATAFGVGPLRIMWRHILPNVLHLVLINAVLEFSALVLYEAVLSYVGVGVDPAMASFGNLINLARSEMSRDPVVWWSISAAFVFMVALVLAANLLADGVRVAFDPRAANWRARLRRRVATRGAKP